MKISVTSAINNRLKLISKLSDGFIVLKGNDLILKSKDCYYPFRQFSSFFYLTGVNLPECRVILDKDADILFVPKPSSTDKIWLGRTSTKNQLKEKFGFKKVLYIDAFDQQVKKMSDRLAVCYTEKSFKNDLKKISSNLKFKITDFEKTVILQRIYKTDAEIRLIKEASRVLTKPFERAISFNGRKPTEYQLKNLFEKTLFDQGIESTSFASIVASGSNSAYLHYNKYDRIMKRGDLCLIDAGAEFEGYASDVTRTFPFAKRFSKLQRTIYQIVLNAQKEAIKAIKPGVLLSDVHDKAVFIICSNLIKINLLIGDLKEIIRHKVYKLFFPHGVSHMLGLDVHDVSITGKNRNKTSLRSDFVLEEGFVITVEPGIYFNQLLLQDKKIRKKYANYIDWQEVDKYREFGGIRIEDNILVTNDGCLNLTLVPKEIDEIEKLISK